MYLVLVSPKWQVGLKTLERKTLKFHVMKVGRSIICFIDEYIYICLYKNVYIPLYNHTGDTNAVTFCGLLNSVRMELGCFYRTYLHD